MQTSECDRYGVTDLEYLRFLLERIHPGCGHAPWFKVMRAIHHETGGSKDGFQLVDHWSSKGQNYKGRKDVRKHWNSIKTGVRPITAGTLIWMARLMKKLYGANK